MARFQSLLRSTPGDKAGSIDGLNLFFGALLGANLGTMQNVPLVDYVRLILILAGSVMTFRMISTSERRWYAMIIAGFAAIAVGGMLFLPFMKFRGLRVDDLHKLIATLAIWLACVLLAGVFAGHIRHHLRTSECGDDSKARESDGRQLLTAPDERLRRNCGRRRFQWLGAIGVKWIRIVAVLLAVAAAAWLGFTVCARTSISAAPREAVMVARVRFPPTADV